jgi:hypothetical protein
VKKKKRNPIRYVNIEKELDRNWWRETLRSVDSMAVRCFGLNDNSREIVKGVHESFILFFSTGLSADIPLSVSPLAYWTDVEHDLDLNRHRSLATLSPSMISTLASEAPCERVFSKMKMLIGDHRFNLSARTIFHMFVIAGI